MKVCLPNFEYLLKKIFFGCIGSSLRHAGFLWLQQASATLRCGAWASHCGGFSCCRAWALGTWASAIVACGLQSAGSVVVAHGPSCSAACGILLDQGSNPCSLHWQADSYPLCHQGSPEYPHFNPASCKACRYVSKFFWNLELHKKEFNFSSFYWQTSFYFLSTYFFKS